MRDFYYVPPRCFFEKGTCDEDYVMEATEKTFGGRCFRKDDEEQRFYDDKFNHIDFWWDSPKMGVIGIDAKGPKKNQRGDKDYDDTMQWLELKGVSGKPGWLYGKAKYIAFRTKTKILFARREKLAKFAERVTEGKELVFENPHGFYIPYQRKKYGKSDVTIKVPMSDIEKLSDFGIKTDDMSVVDFETTKIEV